jgi:hypothetical protein
MPDGGCFFLEYVSTPPTMKCCIQIQEETIPDQNQLYNNNQQGTRQTILVARTVFSHG